MGFDLFGFKGDSIIGKEPEWLKKILDDLRKIDGEEQKQTRDKLYDIFENSFKVGESFGFNEAESFQLLIGIVGDLPFGSAMIPVFNLWYLQRIGKNKLGRK